MINLEPEYRTLREEIGRLQDQVARSLEIGILITSAILTISYSSVIISQYQWLALLSPSLLLTPFVFLIFDRVRTTWIIGRYIELNLEPRLGFQWETYNRHLRAGSNKKFRTRFIRTSAAPLIMIQALCPLLSLSVGVPDFWLWVVGAAIALVIVLVELISMERYRLSKAAIEDMKIALQTLPPSQPLPPLASPSVPTPPLSERPASAEGTPSPD
jgi:hypothetical protein